MSRPSARPGPRDTLVGALRDAGIADHEVLEAMALVPRDRFVPATFASHAWADVALPIGHGQTISQPFIVARMSEALRLNRRHIVLEIGTGSGYQTAILAQLCRRVFTIERHRELWQSAHLRLAEMRLGNVTTRFGDGTKGWVEAGPFDRILITAAAPSVPERLLAALAPAGVLVAPLGQEWRAQTLTRITREAAGFAVEALDSVRFVPLVAGLPRPGQRQSASPFVSGLGMAAAAGEASPP